MKKLLFGLLLLLSLCFGSVAQGQNFSVNIRNWDFLAFAVEAEFYAAPHLSLVAGAGSEVSSLFWHYKNLGVIGGAAYFESPDHSGWFSAGRFLFVFSLSSTNQVASSTSTFLLTTGGYRWLPYLNTQLDVEFGLLWPVSRLVPLPVFFHLGLDSGSEPAMVGGRMA